MNKRIIKKRILEAMVSMASAELVLVKGQCMRQEQTIQELKEEVKKLNARLDEQEKIHSKNVSAINANFNEIKSANKTVRIDLEKQIKDVKNSKRGMFRR